MTFSVQALCYGGFGPVSFALEAGEQISLTGASGAGKTRLLRALADLDAWQGEVLLDGHPPVSVAAHLWRRRVMYLPAESHWWRQQVGEHFTAAPDAATLAALDLADDVLSWPITRLSSGEKQRLALLRALALEPAVLLLDEPTAHLDDERTMKVEAMVRRHCEARGMMAVWVAHDQAQVRRVGARRYLMREKGAWQEDTP